MWRADHRSKERAYGDHSAFLTFGDGSLPPGLKPLTPTSCCNNKEPATQQYKDKLDNKTEGEAHHSPSCT